MSLPLFFGVMYAPCFAVQYLVSFLFLLSFRRQVAFLVLLFNIYDICIICKYFVSLTHDTVG